MSDSYQIRIINSLADVDPQAWDGLLKSPSDMVHPHPFLSHAFLMALEESGSAISETGWHGQHLLLEDENGELLGAMPCYLKNHSQGEYVFDHSWADAFMRAGGNYYPKLQCSVPFTPATGPRLLVPECANSKARRMALLQGLKQLGVKLKVSSAHITFMENDEWEAAGGQDYLQRTDQQFHWLNAEYSDFDSFLQSLSSRKRKNVKKERKTAVQEGAIEVVRLTGDELSEEVWDRFYEFYIDTGSRKWGRPYLTRRFFSLIGERMGDQVLLIMAKRGGRYIAGAINFIGADCLYGRHWGCVEDHPCLHFEVCYYQAIDYAIEHGLSRVEAGAQGAHKLARGYVPVITHSAHFITHPSLANAVADYLDQERRYVEMEARELEAHAPFKKSEK